MPSYFLTYYYYYYTYNNALKYWDVRLFTLVLSLSLCVTILILISVLELHTYKRTVGFAIDYIFLERSGQPFGRSLWECR